jgi:hypothetical protein
MAMAAGCSAGAGSAHSSSSVSPQAAPPAPAAVPAAQAVTLAARQAQQVTSFTATLNVQADGAVKLALAGTMRVRTKPALFTDANFSTLSASGQSIPGGMEEILTGNAVYVKLALLAQLAAGKPWIELPFSQLQQTSGVNLAQILQQVQGNNPLQQTQMLTAAKNVREVGTEVIGGVTTTHYTGTYAVSAGLAALPPSLRASFAQRFKAVASGSVAFDVWLDAQQQVRKLTTTEQGRSGHETTTFYVTGINQPVSTQLPPASEVATVPSTALGG